MNPIFQNNRQQPTNNNPMEMLSQMISGGQNPQQILQQFGTTKITHDGA